MRHCLPLLTAIGAGLLCAAQTACAQDSAAASPAVLSQSITAPAEAQPKLVLQSSLAFGRLLAEWTHDDKFIVVADDSSRVVNVWEVRTGHIVNRIPYPALDPKREIDSWKLILNAANTLTIETNIREPDSSFCTSLAMRYALATPAGWQVETGEPMGPCLAAADNHDEVHSHSGKQWIGTAGWPIFIADLQGKILRSFEWPEPDMAFSADLSPDGKRMAIITNVTREAGSASRTSRVLLFDLTASQIIRSHLLYGFYTDLRWMDNQRLLVRSQSMGRPNDLSQLLQPSPTRIIDGLTGKDGPAPILFRCYTAPAAGSIIAAGLDNCSFKGASGHGLERYDMASGWLVDVVEGVPQGKGLDQWQSAPIEGFDSRLIGTNGYEETAGSDIVVVTAGIARRPGMSRDDLLNTNAGIVKQVSEQIKRTSPNAIIIMVSNPLDVMSWVAKQVTGFPRERVLGMAGVLDTARYRAFLAEAMDVSVRDIQAMVLGGHGDTMVPLVSYTSVSGIPVRQLLAADKLKAIVERTRTGGAEIVGFLKTGSAYYAPSSGAVQMVEAIVNDQKRILPCSTWLQGEYGMKGHFLGVPVKLGRKGIEKILEVTLTADERAALEKSAAAVLEPMSVVKL